MPDPEFPSKLGEFFAEPRLVYSGKRSSVWQCNSPENNRKLAVKLSPRAAAEQKALRQIQHENIAELVDSLDLPPNVVVTQWIGGQTLWNARKSSWAKSPGDSAAVVDVLRPLTRAIAAVHRAGFVHGDIAPDNILVGQSPSQLKLIDFELAHRTIPQASQPDRTDSRRSRGTPITISPECAAGDLATPASDVYSLGCTAYFLTTGNPPHTGRTSLEICYKHLKHPCPPLASDQLPEKICTLVDQMLRRAPHDRPTITEVATELNSGWDDW